MEEGREWRGEGVEKGRGSGGEEGVEKERKWRGVVVEREGGGREEGREWRGAWSEEGRELKRSGFLLDET